jgi:DNA-binding Xre family transcriptional regulator
MQWNLRLAAAQRGIWRASDLRRLLAEAGLVVSAGKMSHLWSGRPISVRLDDLDIICGVLDCEPGELLIRSTTSAKQEPERVTASATSGRSIRPNPARGRRTRPPA